MAYTDDTNEVKRQRAKKMMLWFAMISMAMSFAGLTSAYVVSKSRPDWLTDFKIPEAFYISLGVVILSSLTIYLARVSVQKEHHKAGMALLITTFVLGLLFVILQFNGFSQIIKDGYFFTGAESTITTSFIYLVVILHMGHITGALIALLVVIYNHFKQKYHKGQTLGIELAETFWHFVDILWIYLFLFFYFVR
jgi:heme/copper-type cytochrome/quinol oxidase subunit 3